MYTIQKNPYRTVRHCILTGFALRINFLIKDVIWLKNRGYNEKLVRQQIMKARKYRRTELLHGQREEVQKNKLVFNITYYPILFQ